MQKMTTGDALYNARRAKHLSRSEVAAKTGIAVELIVSYETDRLPINKLHLDKLNGLYGVSCEVLK